LEFQAIIEKTSTIKNATPRDNKKMLIKDHENRKEIKFLQEEI